MTEKKHMLYFMGSFNGDFKLFQNVWRFIKNYLSESYATLFVSGNFGLGNSDFLDQVSKAIDGYATIHIAGGNQAKEAWDIAPPPVTDFFEVRKNIFVHAFGSTHTIGKYSVLFLGHGDAFSYDFFPYPKRKIVDIRPLYIQTCHATKVIEQNNPDIIVSYTFPQQIIKYFLKNTSEDDLRKLRLQDRIVPTLDTLHSIYNKQDQKKRWWFGGSLNIQGLGKSRKNIIYVSLCSFIMVRYSFASLEISNEDSYSTLGNLVYV